MTTKSLRPFHTILLIVVLLSSCAAPSATPQPSNTIPAPGGTLPNGWVEKVKDIVWVTYSPPNADPNKGLETSLDDIRADLEVLREAGFTGLVTYDSRGVMGKDLPIIAEEAGFDGLIMGIWDPTNEEELSNAKAASAFSIVLGFCVGNEGLSKRYEMPVLSFVIDNLREETGKPVTTTEELDDYYDEKLLQLGDWVFPNAHPYFHGQLDAVNAVKWTEGAYKDLDGKTDLFVLFKEVGLPTAGDSEGKLSETVQNQYYQELENTEVSFVYFEAFDQPWKTNLPVEPNWGIFFSDRTPKELGLRLMGEEPIVAIPTSTATAPPIETAVSISDDVFYIYNDGASPYNHFSPSGYMGDTGDIQIDGASEENPQSGETSIQVIYNLQGNGPYTCDYKPPCKWAGVYWQQPANNWGKEQIWAGTGYDLSAYSRLKFWARAETACTLEFKVGGIIGDYGDSLSYPRGITEKLTSEWKEYEIPLDDTNLSYIIGGFVWSTSWEKCPGGATFYLDEIRFEK